MVLFCCFIHYYSNFADKSWEIPKQDELPQLDGSCKLTSKNSLDIFNKVVSYSPKSYYEELEKIKNSIQLQAGLVVANLVSLKVTFLNNIFKTDGFLANI